MCHRPYKTTRKNKEHWKTYHMKDNSRPQLISKKCAIVNCTFGSNGIITFAELATHYRENHSVTQLLKAGVDIHKVRKKCMSSLERW